MTRSRSNYKIKVKVQWQGQSSMTRPEFDDKVKVPATKVKFLWQGQSPMTRSKYQWPRSNSYETVKVQWQGQRLPKPSIFLTTGSDKSTVSFFTDKPLPAMFLTTYSLSPTLWWLTTAGELFAFQGSFRDKNTDGLVSWSPVGHCNYDRNKHNYKGICT